MLVYLEFIKITGRKKFLVDPGNAAYLHFSFVDPILRQEPARRFGHHPNRIHIQQRNS